MSYPCLKESPVDRICHVRPPCITAVGPCLKHAGTSAVRAGRLGRGENLLRWFNPLRGLSPFNRIFAFALVAVVIAIFPCYSHAADDFLQYETKYATVYYRSDKDFYGFSRNIGSLGIFGRSNEQATVRTKGRIDAVVTRAEAILDMHPSNLHVAVYVYATQKELEGLFRSMGIYSETPIAFYSPSRKTIFVSIENITEGVFAHEVAHAVICFYFVTPPPARMQEILAQFVDRNLWQE